MIFDPVREQYPERKGESSCVILVHSFLPLGSFRIFFLASSTVLGHSRSSGMASESLVAAGAVLCSRCTDRATSLSEKVGDAA